MVSKAMDRDLKINLEAKVEEANLAHNAVAILHKKKTWMLTWIRTQEVKIWRTILTTEEADRKDHVNCLLYLQH